MTLHKQRLDFTKSVQKVIEQTDDNNKSWGEERKNSRFVSYLKCLAFYNNKKYKTCKETSMYDLYIEEKRELSLGKSKYSTY